ncbi:MAG: hypothetical protein U0840_02340 [Gemmataceae bacterium]
MLRLSTGLFAATYLLTSAVAVHAGDVQSVRVNAGKVMAVKDFLKGMPKKFAGHKAEAIASLESAEAELWKAIKSGGASSAIRYELSTGGGKKLANCISLLQEVRQELKDAQGGMAGHCLRARRHVEAALDQLEKAQGAGKKGKS